MRAAKVLEQVAKPKATQELLAATEALILERRRPHQVERVGISGVASWSPAWARLGTGLGSAGNSETRAETEQ